jgi:uncharacterized cupin superfamily protein
VKIASVVLFLTSFCFAQVAQQGTAAEVPVDKEPHHHLVFENEYVRVFKVEIPPHESTLVHRHSRDYVVVTIGDAEVTNAVVGKEPRRWPSKDGDVTFVEAAGEKSFAHKAVNEGEKAFVNLTIEIKRSWNTAMRKCEVPQRCERAIRVGDLQVGRSTSLFTNGFVSAYRYDLLPGGTISSNFYASGKNFVLLAALTDLKGNFGGIEQELKATQLFGSDGTDMEITAPPDQALRWVVLRLTWK